MRRHATVALLFVIARAAAAQDLEFGLHTGATNTRYVADGTAGAFQRGASMGLTSAIAMKPWLALQLELLWADKGDLGPNAGAHRYFEVPYMVRLASPKTVLGVRPFGLWGAAQAYELTCVSDCASADRVTTDFSLVKGLGASAKVRRLEIAVEQRWARGQRDQGTGYGYSTRASGRFIGGFQPTAPSRVTSDVRTLVLRLSIVIPGVIPDWM